MKRGFLHTILLFILAGMVSGCSTEKNTRASRAYHNVTSKYNIYFNGKESLKAGVDRIEKSVEDDFTQVIPIFKESYATAGNTSRADMDNAVLKGTKLIQIHSITKKPKRQKQRTRRYQQFASREEFNKWVDDSYMLIGKAYFYQHNYVSASENFSLILRKFPDEKIKYDAMIWLIRSYSEQGRYNEATELIQLLQSDKLFPRKLEKELARTSADMYMKQKDYREAIKFLDIAMKKGFSRKEKARMQYVLAQLYHETGDEDKATEAFRKVRKYNPPFKMDFNARINAAGMFSGKGDPVKLKKELRKMLRDEKNIEFRDQIYFALANLYFREGDRQQAIENYRKSVSSSVDNSFQLAHSSITLADLYFEDQIYKEAQAYYDTAVMVISEDYPGYDQLSQRHASLSRLVENLTVVEVQDSLQKLALMPENERNTLIDKWIAQVKEKQRQEELIARREQSERGFYRANEYRFGMGSASQGGGWYFYNPQTVSFGKAQFQQRWGRRKLEDNWRRKNKSIVSSDEMEEFAELADSTRAVVREDDPLERNYYIQDLPLNDTLMAISHDKIRDALFNAGRIFKSDFSDYPHSAETFEDLNNRYPENIYLLSALFELYDVYDLMGNTALSNRYRDLIISRFPDSKYARYLQNPNFFAEMEARKNELNNIYQETFRSYKAGRYREIIPRVRQMKQLEPDTFLLSKIDFMHTVAEGVLSDMQSFGNGLKGYISSYPKAETTPLAKEILALIEENTLDDYQKLVEMGYLHDEIRNDELQPGNEPENDEFGGKFSYDDDLLHYFVIAYPRNAGIDVNRLKFDIANYNLDHYTKLDFDIEEENLDAANNLILVRSLVNKEQALIYFRAIIRQPEVFRTLSNTRYVNFVASSTNYRQILSEKSTSDYLKFYLTNYSRFIGPDFSPDGAPEESPEELMARAQREDELLQERGRFVTVDVPATLGRFSSFVDTTQSYVLAVMDKNLSLRPVIAQFSDFNRNNFRVWNLALQLKQAGDYQLLVVQGLPGFTESLSYFRKVILERSLFRNLGQSVYRSFIITGKNLELLMQKGDIDNYLEFFRTRYIQSAGQSLTPPAADSAPSGISPGEPSQEVTTPAPYAGPYDADVKKIHHYLFIVPLEGFRKDNLLNQINEFNKSEFRDLMLKIDEEPLDGFRSIIRITEFPDDSTATLYNRKISVRRTLFEPLGTLTYRHFAITPRNYETFLKRKNIIEYLDFVKVAYPEPRQP